MAATSGDKKQPACKVDSGDVGKCIVEAAKKVDLGLLEEDDEFEEFPVEEWTGKEPDEEEEDVNVWEDNWDDDTIEDDFSRQLKAELDKKTIK